MTIWTDKIKCGSFVRFSFVALLILCFSIGVAAQSDDTDYEPPPLNIIPKEDRDKLAKMNSDNARTRLTVDMMRARLQNAETFYGQDDLAGAFRELGIFHGLKDDAINYLEQRKRSGSRNLDQFKRFEISLRGFVPRLETLRREFPLSHERYVADLLRSVRDSRARATDALFSDSVVRVPRNNDPDR